MAMEPPPFALMYFPIESMSDVLFAMLVCCRVDQLQVCNNSTKDPFTVDFSSPSNQVFKSWFTSLGQVLPRCLGVINVIGYHGFPASNLQKHRQKWQFFMSKVGRLEGKLEDLKIGRKPHFLLSLFFGGGKMKDSQGGETGERFLGNWGAFFCWVFLFQCLA